MLVNIYTTVSDKKSLKKRWTDNSDSRVSLVSKTKVFCFSYSCYPASHTKDVSKTV